MPHVHILGAQRAEEFGGVSRCLFSRRLHRRIPPLLRPLMAHCPGRLRLRCRLGLNLLGRRRFLGARQASDSLHAGGTYTLPRCLVVRSRRRGKSELRPSTFSLCVEVSVAPSLVLKQPPALRVPDRLPSCAGPSPAGLLLARSRRLGFARPRLARLLRAVLFFRPFRVREVVETSTRNC